MIKILRKYFNLYFLFIQVNRERNIKFITEDIITYNKICYNPYAGEVYLDFRLRKNHTSDNVFDNYINKKIYTFDMVFYDNEIHRKQTSKFIKVLKFINKGSHYELKLKLNDNWCNRLINEYKLPYEIVNH